MPETVALGKPRDRHLSGRARQETEGKNKPTAEIPADLKYKLAGHNSI
jgi:hypothetical protein